MVEQEVLQLVKAGEDWVVRGQYDKAHESYNKALEYQPGHYLIRNGLGKLMFIKKEYIAAADNFYLAAVDESYEINLDLLLSNSISKPELMMKKEYEFREAILLLNKYTKKAGFSLFAYQYDNPTVESPRQATINRFRNEIDPCGYCGCTEVATKQLIEIEREVTGVGRRYLQMMNNKVKQDSKSTAALEPIMELLSF